MSTPLGRKGTGDRWPMSTGVTSRLSPLVLQARTRRGILGRVRLMVIESIDALTTNALVTQAAGKGGRSFYGVLILGIGMTVQ